MAGLGDAVGHLVEAGAEAGRMLRLDAVDHLLLQAGVDLGPAHRGRGGAHGADRLHPHRRARRAHADAGEVFRPLHRLVGQQVPLALPPVEGQHLMAGRLAQLVRPLVEHRRGDDLADAVVALGEIRAAQNTELLHEDGETPAVDDHRDSGTGAGLLQHVLVLAELRAGEQADGHLAAGPRLDVLLELLQPLVERVLLGQRRVDAERVVGGQRAAGNGGQRKAESGHAPSAGDDAHVSSL